MGGYQVFVTLSKSVTDLKIRSTFKLYKKSIREVQKEYQQLTYEVSYNKS